MIPAVFSSLFSPFITFYFLQLSETVVSNRVTPSLPYCERRWRTPAASMSLLSGPCAASAGSAGSAGCAGTWPTHYPGYAPPPPAPRQSAQRCLRARTHSTHRSIKDSLCEAFITSLMSLTRHTY